MRIATDIGGTFTDIVYIDGEGAIHVNKSHTTPPNFEQGVMDVIAKCNIDPAAVKDLTHGTTVVINALTERKGAKTGLITTRGFRDILEIGRGNRPDLFNFNFKKPEPFVPRYLRLEVSERMDYLGNEHEPLNEDDVRACLETFRKEGVEAIAVVYLHAYVNPAHEIRTKELIHQLWPEVMVTASHEVSKEWREYERESTAVLNSYVMPTAKAYVDRLYQELEKTGITCPKYIMQSNGGTTTFEKAKETPINMVESGPVAGIYGAAMLGKMLGEDKVIAFDIGGTTAKCSLVDGGEVKTTTEYKIEKTDRWPGYPIKVPVVDIVEIGNGGGSIAWVDSTHSLRVGPQSAGALPGPVAYGKGGTQPTTTDANLVIGRLSPKNFDMDVDMDKVRSAIQEQIGNPFGLNAEDAALGIIRVANSNMLNALKLVSVRKGYDPRDFALVAFGGGGPMHAAALAKELNIRKVIVPNAASVFSAWGMLMTDIRHDFIQTRITSFSTAPMEELNAMWTELMAEARAVFAQEGVSEEQAVFTYIADMRYMGQEHTVQVQTPAVPWQEADRAEIMARFHRTHEHFYTFSLPDTPAEIVNLHLVAYGRLHKPELREIAPHEGDIGSALKETRRVFFSGDGWLETPIYDRAKLGAGARAEGPLVVEEPTTATVVCPGQSLSVDKFGNLVVEMEVE